MELADKLIVGGDFELAKVPEGFSVYDLFVSNDGLEWGFDGEFTSVSLNVRAEIDKFFDFLRRDLDLLEICSENVSTQIVDSFKASLNEILDFFLDLFLKLDILWEESENEDEFSISIFGNDDLFINIGKFYSVLQILKRVNQIGNELNLALKNIENTILKSLDVKDGYLEKEELTGLEMEKLAQLDKSIADRGKRLEKRERRYKFLVDAFSEFLSGDVENIDDLWVNMEGFLRNLNLNKCFDNDEMDRLLYVEEMKEFSDIRVSIERKTFQTMNLLMNDFEDNQNSEKFTKRNILFFVLLFSILSGSLVYLNGRGKCDDEIEHELRVVQEPLKNSLTVNNYKIPEGLDEEMVKSYMATNVFEFVKAFLSTNNKKIGLSDKALNDRQVIFTLTEDYNGEKVFVDVSILSYRETVLETENVLVDLLDGGREEMIRKNVLRIATISIVLSGALDNSIGYPVKQKTWYLDELE